MSPLRERREDIPALVEYFVSRFSDEYGKPIRHVSDTTIERLKSYHWPGNVRELENCIRRAVVLCAGDVIFDEHIQIDTEPAESMPPVSREQMLSKLKDKLDDLVLEIMRLSDQKTQANVIELVEEMLVTNALRECGSNQVRAAKRLGISRNTLRNRIKKYGIKVEAE